MEALYRLVKSMSKSEARIFRASLTTGAYRSEQESKTLKLFDLLSKSDNAPMNNDCSQKIYGEARDKRFKMLKLRFKSKLLDSLFDDINIERYSPHLDEYDNAGIKIRKKIAQFHQLYYSKGNQIITMQLLEEVISLSKKWENYLGIIEGLRIKKLRTGFSKGEAAFEKLNSEVNFYEKCYKYLNEASDLYYGLMMRSSFYSQETPSINTYLKSSITKLKKFYAETKSINILYCLLFFELGLLQSQKNFSHARKVCLEILLILRKNKAAYRKLRVGSTYLNLGQCHIWLDDYRAAVENIRTAQQYFSVNSANYAVAKEQEFLALLYGNQVAEAGQVAAELLKTTTAHAQGDFRLAKYEFYQANSLFKKGEFKAALKILGRKHELSRDKIGWEIAIRILSIMTLIELERLDDAGQQTEGLRKHMERHSKMKELRERDRLILKALQAMNKTGYVKGKLSTELKSILEKLQAAKGPLRWEPVTPELIPFDQWMAARYKRK